MTLSLRGVGVYAIGISHVRRLVLFHAPLLTEFETEFERMRDFEFEDASRKVHCAPLASLRFSLTS